ncbi:MAG TPA: amino acid adenylation domain-containing protein, partial [Kofleriaceae bacterium]
TDGSVATRQDEPAAPRAEPPEAPGALERWLAEQIAAQLGVRVGELDVSAPITRYGLDSLGAVELGHALERATGAVIAMERLLAGPSIAALAAQIAAARASGTAGISPAPAAAALTAGLAQQRLWFLDRLHPGDASYNLPAALRLRGPLDAARLARALSEIVRRHAALRTVFAIEDGAPVPRVLPAGEVALAIREVSGPDLAAQLAALARQPFDLERGPLLRAELLRLTGDDHVLVIVVHHIAADGLSMAVLARELEAHHAAGGAAALPALAVQYTDFARWQRDQLTGAVIDAELAYWRARLTGAAALELPTDLPRPAVQDLRGATHPVHLPAALVGALRRLGQAYDATLFMVVMAGLHALFHRYSGQDDITIGTAVAGRDRADLDGLIGFFVHTLPVRVDVSGDPSFATLLGRVRAATLEAYAHQQVPFERLVDAVQPARDLSRPPIVQAMLVLRPPVAPPVLAGLAVEATPIHAGASAFELQLQLTEGADGLTGELEYATSLFEPATIARLIEHLTQLLASAAEAGAELGAELGADRPIGELAVSSDAERARLLVDWNRTPAAVPHDRTIVARFEACAAERPDAPAVIHAGRTLGYAEVNARANQLARRLRALGVGPDRLVGLHVDRTPELVIGALGILKAGGAYVPLDPGYPAERLAYILDDARPEVIVGLDRLPALPPSPATRVQLDGDAAALAALDPADLAEPGAGPGHADLAYLIYTSGSTGRPKAVAIEHRSAAVLVAWARGVFDDRELAGVLAATSLCFDLSVFELFVPLAWGGAVIMARDALALPELADRDRVTLVNTVPSAMAELVRAGGLPPSVRTVNLAGEALPGVLAERLYALGVDRVLNLYGPSEDTTYSTYAVVPRGADRPPAIGRPISHTQAYLLDHARRPVPLGALGELYLGGLGLARGYLHQPELTREKFVADPFGGGRLYRTGDLARYRADGELEFRGRIDHQVKIRGFRIELGEIEAVLAEHPAIEDVIAVAREDHPGDPRVVAYVTQRDRAAAGDASGEALRTWLGHKLPAYLVPSAIVRLDALPLTPNGKVDRKALPAPAGASERPYAAPATPTEVQLAELWRQLLHVGRVGRDDRFFALGGHSLLAMQLVSRIARTLGVSLPVREVFDAPTLADLAERIAARVADGAAAGPALIPGPASEQGAPAPLSFAQQQIWVLDQLEPDSAQYNLPAAIRLDGALDRDALGRALAEIVRRHAALRTVFRDEGAGAVQVVEPAAALVLATADLRGHPAPADELSRLTDAAARAPFSLTRGPLVRATLVALAEREHVLVLVLHHIVSDGWSLGVLARELSALYAAFRAGRPSPLAELPVQYADYARWQRA